MSSLRTRFILFIAVVIVLCMATMTGVAYLRMGAAITEGLNRELGVTLDGRAKVISDWISTRKLAVESTLPFITQEAVLKEHLGQGAVVGGFDLFYTGFADKRMIYSITKEKPPGYDPTVRPWYVAANAAGGTIITEPYIAKNSQKLVVTFAAPSKIDGQVKAVVGGDVNLENIVKNVLSLKLPASGFSFLVRRDGKLIGYPQAEAFSKPIRNYLPSVVDVDVMAAQTASKMATIDLNGHSQLLKMASIPGSDWYLGIVLDKSAVLAPLSSLLWALSVSALVLVAVLTGFTWIGVGRLLRGLKEVGNAMERISSGDADLTHRLPVTNNDEVGRIAMAFNQFVAQLQKMFLSVREQANCLAHDSHQLIDAVQKISGDSKQQSAELTTSAATIEEITGSIALIADHVRDTSTRVDEIDSSSRASSGMVVSVAQEIGNISEQCSQLSRVMDSLGDRSERIQSIVNVIKDIADQTNLLALNAAIEAARAGEQGRGFAVVADEVRKLAERTGEATVEIGSMIGSIQGDTQVALVRMGSAVKAVEQGVCLSQEAATRIQAIRMLTDDMVVRMNDIANATCEQQTATTAMAQSAERINAMSQQTDEAIQHASKTIRSLGELAFNLQGIVARFKL